MRGLGVLAALGLLHAGPAFALAAGADHAELEFWKGLNFLIILGVIVWAARKYGRPFFQGRTREIRKQMVEAEEIRAEADRRTAEVEARLANLESEIEALRREALADQQAGNERFSRRVAADMEKVNAQAEAEIEAAGKQARLELKRYTAQLAVGLAERKIRERMTPAVQSELVDSFVEAIAAPASRAQVR
jgi:F-type H+-transporting ATPase subunit b